MASGLVGFILLCGFCTDRTVTWELYWLSGNIRFFFWFWLQLTTYSCGTCTYLWQFRLLMQGLAFQLFVYLIFSFSWSKLNALFSCWSLLQWRDVSLPEAVPSPTVTGAWLGSVWTGSRLFLKHATVWRTGSRQSWLGGDVVRKMFAMQEWVVWVWIARINSWV